MLIYLNGESEAVEKQLQVGLVMDNTLHSTDLSRERTVVMPVELANL